MSPGTQLTLNKFIDIDIINNICIAIEKFSIMCFSKKRPKKSVSMLNRSQSTKLRISFTLLISVIGFLKGILSTNVYFSK